MAQIFVSHSQMDKDIIHFFLEAFAGTKVKPHLEEFEKMPPTGVSANKIAQDIQTSNAVFVLLSENVEKLNHTRDWVTWECGAATNKDIWIFEPAASLGKIRIVVPRFNHYVLFDISDEWRKYISSLIEAYDDSHVLPALSASTTGGAMLNEKDRVGGAAAGFAVGLVGLLLYNMNKPSYGIPVRCPQCFSNYKIHQQSGNFRCAVCNLDLMLPQSMNFINAV